MNKKDKGLIGNEKIEEAITKLKDSFNDESLAHLLSVIRKRISEKGEFVIAIDAGGENNFNGLQLKTAKYNGFTWFVAFTSFEEEMKGGENVMSGFMADMGQLFDMAINNEAIEGILINPFGEMLTVNKAVIEVIRKNKGDR